MVRIAAILFVIFLAVQTFAQAPATSSLLRITVHNKIGFIDLTGKVIIEPQFKAVGKFVDGLAPARKGGTYGYIDTTGAFVIPDIYDYAEDFSEGYGVVYLDGKPQYIDRYGKIQFSFANAEIQPPKNGLAIVTTNSDKVGIIDARGTFVVDTLYRSIKGLTKGFYRATTYDSGKYQPFNYYILDQQGKRLFTFDGWISTYENGYFLGQVHYLGDYVIMRYDTSGSEKLLLRLSDSVQVDVIDFHEGVVPVTIHNRDRSFRCIILDIDGKQIDCDTEMFRLSRFQNGVAIAEYDSNVFYFIDKSGKRLQRIPTTPERKIDNVAHFSGKFYKITSGTKMGLCDVTATPIMECRYEKIVETPNPRYVYWTIYGRLKSDRTREPTQNGFFDLLEKKELPYRVQFFQDSSMTKDAFEGMIDSTYGYFTYDGKNIWKYSEDSVESGIDYRFIDADQMTERSYVTEIDVSTITDSLNPILHGAGLYVEPSSEFNPIIRMYIYNNLSDSMSVFSRWNKILPIM